MDTENPMPTELHTYFLQVAEIWAAFNNGKISAQMREALLAPYRKTVFDLPISGFHNQSPEW